MTRWMCPPGRERTDERARFDAVVEGARHGLSSELSLAIWRRVCADATDGRGRFDESQARQRFVELAERIGLRGGRLYPDVGRVTRASAEGDGEALAVPDTEGLNPLVPGRYTLAAVEQRRHIKEQWRHTKADAAAETAPHGDIAAASVSRSALVGKAASPRLGFDDYRVLGLKAILSRLGPDHPLRREVTAPRVSVELVFARPGTVRSEPLRSPMTASAHALWHVAELHAATLFRRAIADGAVDRLDPAIQSALERRGSGRSLPLGFRREMERELGISLAGVRVHTDTASALAARALSAEAFTLGEDIFFSEGAFAPDTLSGRKLLAHELAHVAQALRGSMAAPSGELRVSQPGEPLEQEADAVAARIADAPAHGNPVPAARDSPAGSTTPAIPDRTGAEQDANLADAATAGSGYPESRARSTSLVIARQVHPPDIDRGGFQTFYVDVDRFRRVLAFQIGVQPNQRRLSVRLAALSPGLTNPPENQRTMVLALPVSMPRTPRIISQTESQVEADVYERLIIVELAGVEGAPLLNVVARFGRTQGSIPFPDGHIETRNLDTAWMSVSDGVNTVAVNFYAEIPGSLFTSEWVPFVHPALGFGYRNVDTGRFVPRPSGDAFAQALPSPAPEEVARFAIHMIPIAGSLVMAYEAIRGRTIFGRRMSTTERVLLGAGAVLAELGPLLRAGEEVVRGARAISAASDLARVTRLPVTESLRLVYGARVLTAAERSTLSRLAGQVESGMALSAADQVVVNRLLGKLSEPARALSLRAEIEAATGTAAQPGRFTVPGAARASADEARVGTALAHDLNADVIKVPESTVQGVRSGDYLVNGQFVEAYAPQTARLDNILRQAVSKHQQAGTLVIDLTRSGANAQEVIAAAPRIFGRPEAADLSRIVYVNGDRVIADVARPGAAPLGPDIVEGMVLRGAASAGSQAGQGGRDR